MAQRKTPLIPKPRKLPAGHVLDENVRRLMNKPNVVAAFVGKKQRKGKDTGQLSLVCGVSKKIPEKDLEPSHIIPKAVEIPITRVRSTRIATDVIPMHGRFEAQANMLGPSDLVLPDQFTQATIGIALNHPTFGKVITTAGHAVQGVPTGSPMIVSSGGDSFSVRLAAEPRINQRTDHALLAPENQDIVGNFFRDVTPLGPPFIPDPNQDVGTPLFILPSDRDVITVICRGLHGSVRVGSNLIMNDLILTDLRTVDGDSGACVVDGNWRVWGVLLGRFETTDDNGNLGNFSVFIPAFRILLLEGAQFM